MGCLLKEERILLHAAKMGKPALSHCPRAEQARSSQQSSSFRAPGCSPPSLQQLRTPPLTDDGIHPRVLRDHRPQVGRKVEQGARHGLRQRQPRVELLRSHPAVRAVGADLWSTGGGMGGGSTFPSIVT